MSDFDVLNTSVEALSEGLAEGRYTSEGIVTVPDILVCGRGVNESLCDRLDLQTRLTDTTNAVWV